MTTPAVVEFLESLKAKYPNKSQLRQEYTQLCDIYKRRLWHQLTQKLIEFLKVGDSPLQQDLAQGQSELIVEGDELILLYERFIRDFEKKINQLKFVQILIVISKQYTNLADAIKFLDGQKAKVASTTDAAILLSSALGALYVANGQLDQAKLIQDELRSRLDSLSGLHSTVYAYFYHTSLLIHKVGNQPADFYRAGLSMLSYINLDTVALNEKISLAFQLSLAGLIGETIFNFGELLGHPIIESLKGTDKEWMLLLLKTFNAGNIPHYEELQNQYQTQLNSIADLQKNKQILDQKIRILYLMELVFHKPSEDRSIPFSVIAQATKLPLHEVELLVMKALSAKLVRGVIDQVSGVVNFTWVQPRVLDLQQIGVLRDNLKNWATTVNQTLILMESETPELFS